VNETKQERNIMKPSTFFAILGIIVLCVLALATMNCGNDNPKPPSTGDGVFTGKLRKDNEAKTPKGITVYSGWRLDPSLFDAYDRGLEKNFRIAKQRIPDYPLEAPRFDQYTIWEFPRSEKCQAPAFLVSSQFDLAWDQTEYDKDDRPGWVLLCAAGMMIRNGDRGLTPGMVIAQDASHAENIVWFEAEHNELLDFWRSKYEETAGQHGHPILGDESVGLKAPLPPEYRTATIEGGHTIALVK
jgi:hypothetical protein